MGHVALAKIVFNYAECPFFTLMLLLYPTKNIYLLTLKFKE